MQIPPTPIQCAFRHSQFEEKKRRKLINDFMTLSRTCTITTCHHYLFNNFRNNAMKIVPKSFLNCCTHLYGETTRHKFISSNTANIKTLIIISWKCRKSKKGYGERRRVFTDGHKKAEREKFLRHFSNFLDARLLCDILRCCC